MEVADRVVDCLGVEDRVVGCLAEGNEEGVGVFLEAEIVVVHLVAVCLAVVVAVEGLQVVVCLVVVEVEEVHREEACSAGVVIVGGLQAVVRLVVVEVEEVHQVAHQASSAAVEVEEGLPVVVSVVLGGPLAEDEDHL